MLVEKINMKKLNYTEDLLKKQFNIDVACIGTDDKMIIYTTDLEQKDNIINFLVVTLKLNRIVFETRYLKNIPRSETAKVLYAELPIK